MVWTVQLVLAVVTVYISTHLFPHNPTVKAIADWYQGFGRWDGGWYRQIAEFGYTKLQATAFFPLYPLLIRAVHSTTHLSYLWSGFIISNLSFLFALVFLFKLVKREYNTPMAQRTLFLLTIFPAAMFYNVTYTESTTLLTTVLFFYFLRNDRWYSAMLSGFVATGVHDLGVVLAFPALLYLIRNRKDYTRGVFWWRFLSIGIIGLSLVLYMVFLQLNFGTFLGFARAQAYWDRIPVIPIFNILINLAKLIFKHGYGYSFMMLINGLSSLAFVGLGLLMFTRCKDVLALDMRVFFIITLFLSITSGAAGNMDTLLNFLKSASLDSYARFMSVIFPGFILLAHLIQDKRWFYGCAACGLFLKFTMLALFANGYVVI